jgi:hypothetical protein
MEMVYLINGGGSGGGGGDGRSSGYPLVKAVVTDGAVGLQDRSVTRVDLKTAAPVRINFPPKTEGVARDLLLRLVITADSVPEVTFAVPTGETFSFEEGDDETFSCLVGVNIFAFTETDDGLFVVSRKLVSIVQEVAFDAAGGEVDTPVKDYLLGAKYGSLPVPTRRGYTFLRWLTEDGVEIAATDTVKTSVTRLVAEWEVYVDKYAPAIGPASGLVFTSDGDAKWALDVDAERGEVARSGAIGDSQRSSLFAEFEGAGSLSFWWKVSSESGYDKATLFVDGVSKATESGEQDWRKWNVAVSGTGRHRAEWRYQKDGSVARGGDCVWLDDVTWEAS